MDSNFQYQPPKSPVDILYQDKDVVVVNKPSGLLSVPGKSINLHDSMLTRLQVICPTALVVHRLDMDTSGILIFALRKKAERNLREQFRNRNVAKKYIAVVQGYIDTDAGVIDAPLAPDPHLPLRHCVSPCGKPSRTEYRVLNHCNNKTLVQLTPITGRSHQLRVHLLSLGHPIIGDRFYASDEVQAKAPRLLLHAEEICFRQPYSQAMLSFRCESGFSLD